VTLPTVSRTPKRTRAANGRQERRCDDAIEHAVAIRRFRLVIVEQWRGCGGQIGIDEMIERCWDVRCILHRAQLFDGVAPVGVFCDVEALATKPAGSSMRGRPQSASVMAVVPAGVTGWGALLQRAAQ